MEQGDVKVILLILIGVVSIVIWRFQKWITGSSRRRGRIPRHANIPGDDVVELLEAAGFDVLAGKTKIPITMTVGERDATGKPLIYRLFCAKG